MQQSSQFAVRPRLTTRTMRVASFIVASVVVGGAAFAQGPPDPRGGASTPVQVLNTTENPVPVTGTVSVSILGNEPLPVRVVDSATMTPFHAFIRRNPQVPGFPFTPFTVPASQRLVIEYVSGELTGAAPCATAPRMLLRTTVGGTTLTHYFYPEDTGVITEGPNLEPARAYGLSRETRLYADPGTQVLAEIRLDAHPGCGYRTNEETGLHISGYLVEVP